MMKLPDVAYYKTDLTGKNSDNLVEREYRQRVAGKRDLVFVPFKGHFFHKSVKMYFVNGKEMDLGTHYEFYDISRSLTALVKNASIGLFIKLLDPTIEEWYISYQVLGNFSIINNQFSDYIISAINDDRPVMISDINGLPKWFPPELHQHDLRYEIHSFKDIIEQITRINDVYGVLPDRERVSIDHFYSTISFYINDFKDRLTSAIKQHDSENKTPHTNDHGLTAKQMQLENVDNFETATYIQILEGIRSDLHITADLTNQVVTQYAKESDQLFHKGVLPLIRYGSNNFIPPSIAGSFEGMGGVDFNVGFNVEPDGTALMLCPRNDGKTSGLYFIRNNSAEISPSGWEFTAFKYTHQKATQDGVSLTSVVSGSDGYFLVIGDGTKFYWAYTNGTLDPTKHTLNAFPQELIDSGVFSGGVSRLRLVTEGGSDKILLFRIWTSAEMYTATDKVKVGWDLPTYENLTPTTFSPAEPVNTFDDFLGFSCWEISKSDMTWKKVTFKYSNVGKDDPVVSPYYVPFKNRIAMGPRPDGTSKYGIFDSLFSFKYGINVWVNYRNRTLIGLYDNLNKRIALKFIFMSYGIDDRPKYYNGQYTSIGFSMENPIYENGGVSYDVVKGKGMAELRQIDNTVPGSVPVQNDLDEKSLGTYAGMMSSMKYQDNYIYIGSLSNKSLPVSIAMMKLKDDPVFNDYHKWFNVQFSADVTKTSYNEVNPIGLTVGMHSDCYLLPSLGNADSFGSITTGSIKGTPYKLWYRRMDAMNQDKTFKAPNTNFTLYNQPVKGYSLSNNVRAVNLHFLTAINTLTVLPSDPKWSEFMGHYFSHHTVPLSLDTDWNNKTAVQEYVQEAKAEFGPTIKFTPTKTLLLGPVMDTVVIPMIKNWGENNGHGGDFENIRATYQLHPANLKGGNSDQYVYIATAITKDEVMFVLGCLIQFEGGDYINGMRTPTNATVIGEIKIATDNITLPGASEYRKKDTNILVYQDVDMNAPVRPVIAQQPDGSTVIFSDTYQSLPYTGISRRIGFIAKVTLEGLQDYDVKRNYHIGASKPYSPHPYYKVIRCRAAMTAGASIIGNPIAQDPNNIYDNLKLDKILSTLTLNTSNYIEGAFTVYFKSSEKVTLGGTDYILSNGYVDLYDIDPSPANKTFYCYLSYTENGVNYKIVPSPIADTYSNALLATIKTNATGIIEIRSQNVFTMNGFRINNERHGATIPAASGTITGNGQTAGWGDNDADLS